MNVTFNLKFPEWDSVHDKSHWRSPLSSDHMSSSSSLAVASELSLTLNGLSHFPLHLQNIVHDSMLLKQLHLPFVHGCCEVQPHRTNFITSSGAYGVPSFMFLGIRHLFKVSFSQPNFVGLSDVCSPLKAQRHWETW